MSATPVTTARGRSAVVLLFAGILWGTGGLSGSLLATEAGLRPLSVAAYRLLVGGFCAIAILAGTGGFTGMVWTKPVVRRILVSGALMCLFQSCYFAAVSLTSVSLATMITIGSVPVLVALATSVRERRRPATGALAAIAVAVAGLVLLTWSPQGLESGWRPALGVVLALACGGGFATLTLVSRHPVEGLDPWRTTAFALLVGGLLATPAALWSGMTLPLRPKAIGAALYLGLGPTALGYAAYFRALRRAHPVVTALAVLLEPLTAAVLSAVVLGDRLGLTGWCGAALMAGALAFGSRLRGET
ncbi:DMT family transporter [Amycolatopsis pigmentata]|uniref:DMT family transporter n=1 Tax=Amycolatopsis pigmentata TaxID=450801 RepID=A0ABW5FV61_9PSEU